VLRMLSAYCLEGYKTISQNPADDEGWGLENLETWFDD